MYKLPRQGNVPLVHIDEAIVSLGTLPAGAVVGDTVWSATTQDATIRTRHASVNMNGVIPAMGQNTQCLVGVAVNGEHPGEGFVLNSIEWPVVTFGFAMTVRLRNVTNFGRALIHVHPFVGRASSATLVAPATGPNGLSSVDFLQVDHLDRHDSAIICSAKTAFLVGNFNGSDTWSDNPVIAGFAVWNYDEVATTESFRFDASVNLWKYDRDLLSYDPQG